MSQARIAPMTPAEFLTWEAGQEFKWEFDGFEPQAMAGVTNAHAAIQQNLALALGTRLRGQSYYVRGSDFKVQTGLGCRYPDAHVGCTTLPNAATIATEPVVIFEIISESTEHTDRFDKLREYRAIPSVRRYVILEQDQALATTYTRTEAGWVVDDLGLAGILAMPEIGIEVPMAEFYEGLAFSDPARPAS
jgi:Uma2 family endonuclease